MIGAWEFTEQVNLGMKVLDQHWPGWEKRVDLAKLNLRTSSHCILGQVFGHMNNGVRALVDMDPGTQDYNYWQDHGFIPGRAGAGYGPLTRAWKQAIQARSAA